MNLSKVRPLFEAIERAEASMYASPVHFYTPNAGCQEAFHKSQAEMRIILGGNSSGKSYCGLGAEVAYHVVEGVDTDGNKTGYAVHPYRKIRLPVNGAISSATEEVQRRTKGGTQSYFQQFLERDIKESHSERGAYKNVILKNGCEIEFITDASGRAAYQSATFNFIAMDEPHQPAVINEAQMRLIREPNCRLWWAFTPVIDPKSKISMENIQYAIREYIRPALQRQRRGEPHDGTEVWFMPTKENENYIDYSAAERATSRMSKEERRIRLTGEYVEMMLMSGFNVEALENIENECFEPREGDLILNDTKIEVGEEVHYLPDFKEGHALHFWYPPEPGHKYVIGVDVGGRVDPTSATVIDVNHHNIVAEFHGWMQETDLARSLQLLGYYYNKAMIGVETNKEGKVTVELMRRGHSDLGIVRYPNLYMRPKSALLSQGFDVPSLEPGWMTTGGAKGTRELLIGNVRMFIARSDDAIHRGFSNPMPSWKHVEEAMTFSPNSQGKLEAETGKNDDRIISLGIALQVMKRVDRSGWLDGETIPDTTKKEVLQLSKEGGGISLDFGYESEDHDRVNIAKDYVP